MAVLARHRASHQRRSNLHPASTGGARLCEANRHRHNSFRRLHRDGLPRRKDRIPCRPTMQVPLPRMHHGADWYPPIRATLKSPQIRRLYAESLLRDRSDDHFGGIHMSPYGFPSGRFATLSCTPWMTPAHQSHRLVKPDVVSWHRRWRLRQATSTPATFGITNITPLGSTRGDRDEFGHDQESTFRLHGKYLPLAGW